MNIENKIRHLIKATQKCCALKRRQDTVALALAQTVKHSMAHNIVKFVTGLQSRLKGLTERKDFCWADGKIYVAYDGKVVKGNLVHFYTKTQPIASGDKVLVGGVLCTMVEVDCTLKGTPVALISDNGMLGLILHERIRLHAN